MEYLECLLSQQNHLASKLDLLALYTSAIMIAYALTFSKSKVYFIVFMIVEISSKSGHFGLVSSYEFIGFQLHSITASIQCILFAYILSKTNSKSQRIICGMIVTIDVLMAIGYLTGGEFALYLYNNYESIVLCLHVCLILSLYKPKPIINAMVGGIRKLFRIVDDILFFSAIRYNQIRTMQMLRTI